MSCCDDPTEPVKINRTDVARAQEQYGNLMRELFTNDPEKVMLKQVNEASTYLRELAALNAHYDSVKIRAIKLLGKTSISTLQRVANKYPDTEISQCAIQRIEYLETDRSLFRKIFN